MRATRWPALIACATMLIGHSGSRMSAQATDCTGMNVLTPAERTDGWMLLFDGATKAGWHGYNQQDLASWTIDDCALKTVGVAGNYGSDKRADLVTDREFTNFELRFEWKASKGGNSGVIYGVIE